MLTEQDVSTAYRLILGREPESLAIVGNFVQHSNFDHLRTTLLGSNEFAERLSRNPQLLAVPMAALTMTTEVRRYKQLVEALAGLGLPIWEISVLVVGDEAACLLGFFLDRRCKVTVAASAKTTRLLELCVGASSRDAANATMAPCDFGAMDAAMRGRHDLVYGELADNGSDNMRGWLDNAAEACSGSMIILCKTAPGRSEEVFVTRNADETMPSRTVATRKWVVARLYERFEHVYEPTHAFGDASVQKERSSTETSAVFIASRSALSLPSLVECIRPAPRAPAASIVRMR